MMSLVMVSTRKLRGAQYVYVYGFIIISFSIIIIIINNLQLQLLVDTITWIHFAATTSPDSPEKAHLI